jgi:hypothetical protein
VRLRANRIEQLAVNCARPCRRRWRHEPDPGEPQVILASDGRVTISVPIQQAAQRAEAGDSAERGRHPGLGMATRHLSNWRWPGGTGGSLSWGRVRQNRRGRLPGRKG